MDTIPNGGGCDSVMTITVTINTADTSVTDNAPTLTANATGAVFQWLNCDNNFAIIIGETNQTFTATTNGSYAVEVTENGCTDTSACFTIIGTGIDANNFGDRFKLYPNPSNGELSIELGAIYRSVKATVRNELMQEISTESYKSTDKITLQIEGEPGVYFIELETSNGKMTTLKVIKE